jgi:hypothetical protein
MKEPRKFGSAREGATYDEAKPLPNKPFNPIARENARSGLTAALGFARTYALLLDHFTFH